MNFPTTHLYTFIGICIQIYTNVYKMYKCTYTCILILPLNQEF